ncbi:MAG: cell division protein ZapA [Bacteroidales bacterium]|nr:cell division protein ZapA [Bacteroidales bacterium]
MNEITATVTILERNYSLRVAEGDAEILQAAAHRLDEMSRGFGKQFPNKDHQDLITMTALLHEVQLLKLQQRQSAPLADIERRLTLLDEYLSEAVGDK